jgi:hypothetical protein
MNRLARAAVVLSMTGVMGVTALGGTANATPEEGLYYTTHAPGEWYDSCQYFMATSPFWPLFCGLGLAVIPVNAVMITLSD